MIPAFTNMKCAALRCLIVTALSWAGSFAYGADLARESHPQLEQRLAMIDAELKGLAHTRLSRRAWDGRYIFQLSEVLVFGDDENRALHQPVTVSSDSVPNGAWNRRFVVDGILVPWMSSATPRCNGARAIAWIYPLKLVGSRLPMT